MESQFPNADAESFQPKLYLTSLEGNNITTANGTGLLTSTDPDQPWDIESLEKILNYKFNDKSLLMQAFTEASYVGEECNSYEVLELLGDAVLHMVITTELVNLYPQESAGQLTKLRAVNVDTEKLARVAVKHKLYRYIRHKKPLLEEQILEFVTEMEKYPLHSYGLLNVPKSLANIVESTIGALFKDCNSSIETVWKVMKPLLEPIIPIDKLQNHPVTELNELCQKRHLNLTHHDSWNTNKTYYFLINEKLVGCGHHHKKDTARSCAAKNALDNLPYFFPCPSVS